MSSSRRPRCRKQQQAHACVREEQAVVCSSEVWQPAVREAWGAAPVWLPL